MNNKLLLLVSMCLIFSLSCHRKIAKVNNVTSEDMKNDIPLSVINNGVTLNVDFSGMKGNNDVLFFDSTCVITSLNDKASILIATPKFDPAALPLAIQNELYSITNVYLSTGNPFEDQKQPLSEVPSWLKKISELKYLRLEDIKLKNLTFLQKLKIKQLILIRVELENRDAILNDISNLINLQYLVSNNLFTPKEVLFLKGKLPELVMLTEMAYNKKVENGEISIQE